MRHAVHVAPLRSALVAILSLLGGLVGASGARGQDLGATERPNFVVVLVDDAAFMDFGVYGGEANTPTIDALAARGAIFSRYHTSPLCSPSRAMLLTGLDNHLTGVSTIQEVLPPEQRGKPGYTLSLEPGVTTIASRLQTAGYHTAMTGKWHLGHGPGELPNAHGFARSFVLDASGADNWEQKPYMPYYRTADWFEDGEPARLPEEFYSSEFLVDQMIAYLDEGAATKPDAPFFAYLAFQAVHIPVQAPTEFTARYADVYDEGWDAVREARHARAQALGLIAPNAPLAAPPESLRAWSSLSADERALYAKNMAVNAGMLEAMDHHLGRLVAHLKAQGRYANTIFVITSDNGPEPSNPIGERGFGLWMALQGYTHELETLGERGSYAFIGPEWAVAAAAPGALFKFYASEGGVRAPLVVAGPGVASGADGPNLLNAAGFVSDLAPTILDFAGLSAEPDAFTGRSLRPVLAGDAGSVYGPDDAVGLEVSGNAALFKGDWKLTRNQPPWGDGTWRLFDLANDPGETLDLSDAHPAIRSELEADYQAYAARVGVLELPEGYQVQRQVAANAIARQVSFYWWIPALGLLALVGVVGLVLRALRRA